MADQFGLSLPVKSRLIRALARAGPQTRTDMVSDITHLTHFYFFRLPSHRSLTRRPAPDLRGPRA